MRDRLQAHPMVLARALVWGVLTVALLGYLWFGTELVAMNRYYNVRYSVPSIWDQFYEGLPEVGNQQVLDIVFWVCIAVLIPGVLALGWMAFDPLQRDQPVELELENDDP
ncbi:MAG: hypothetical protein KC438_03390 [Thermomicrobiales bacterium]|nr:hypothetical protein [Thermomicrobiales bacterium]MCO5222539.1 hypothetical protein [Thermomicrobiales bacterium]